MRHLLIFLVALTACNKVYTPETSRPAVVFGDSIAFGTGTSHQRFNLASCLGKHTGAYFKNMGVPGETTREARNRLPQLLALKPRMVILSIGGNDLQDHLNSLAVSLGKRGTFPASETQGNLTMIFEQLQKEGIPVFYVNMDPPFLLSNVRSVAAAADGRLSKIEALTRQFPSVHFVKRAMEGLWQNSEKMSDEIHPNDSGYTDMCIKILEQIKMSGQRSSG